MQFVFKKSVSKLLSCSFFSIKFQDQMSENIIGRPFEAFPYCNLVFLGLLLISLQGLVDTSLREFFEYAMICCHLGIESDVAVFKQCHQCSSLEYRAGLSRTANCHVQILAKFPSAVFLQVRHSLDGSGLDIHHYCTSTFDAVIVGDVLPQCSICNVLNVDVKSCHDISSILNLDDCAVRIDDSAFVCFFHPLHAFFAMQYIVILAFNTHKTVSGRVVMVHTDVSDQPSSKFPVWIFSCLLFAFLHAADVSAMLVQRQLFHLEKGTMIYSFDNKHRPSAFLCV